MCGIRVELGTAKAYKKSGKISEGPINRGWSRE